MMIMIIMMTLEILMRMIMRKITVSNNEDKDFDTEWNDFQNIVTQLGEKFKGYWN